MQQRLQPLRPGSLALLSLLAVAVGIMLAELADRLFYSQVLLPGRLEGDALVGAFGFSFIFRPAIAAIASLATLLVGLILTNRTAQSGGTNICLPAALVVTGSILLSIAYSLAEMTLGRFFP